jgi:hypothetical protein
MDNRISSYFDKAQLAMAAYAKNLFAGMDIDEYIRALRNDADFSEKQATDFAATYEIVDQYSDTVTGFSATVFKHRESGKYSLAIRGTDFPLDLRDWLVADGRIALFGSAFYQTFALYNYFQRLITPAGEEAPQRGYDLQAAFFPVPNPLNGFTFSAPGLATQENGLLHAEGNPVLLAAGSLNVAGHSPGWAPGDGLQPAVSGGDQSYLFV